MPRPPRTMKEVEEARNRILQAALELFDASDYQEVSMRKIAARAGCSAATIYHYYRNKDALYLDVLKRGFQILLDTFMGEDQPGSAAERLDGLVRSFYRFSVEYPSYYDIMFSLPVPKYLDYVGTAMESTAWDQKRVAVASLELAAGIIAQGQAQGEFKAQMDPKRVAVSLLAACHGMVSLHRSRVLPEIEHNPEEAYFHTARTIIAQLIDDSDD